MHSKKGVFLILIGAVILSVGCRITVGSQGVVPPPTGTIIVATPQPTQTERVVVVTATPEQKVAQSPPSDTNTIYALCKCRWQRTPLTSKTYLSWAWIAATAVLARDFIEASTVSVFLDGRSLGILKNYWGPVEYRNWIDFGNGYGAVWSYPLIEIPNLKPGLHRFEVRVDLSRQVTDGFDSNNDGKPDQFGPGMSTNGWVEVELY